VIASPPFVISPGDVLKFGWPLYRLFADEHGHFSWGEAHMLQPDSTRVAALKDLAAVTDQPLFGYAVEVDDMLPPGVVEIRDAYGTKATIVGIGE